MTDDARHMAHALRLGRRGMGQCWPNPAVGCVIVREGRVVGRGWTQPGGRPHAEPVALAQAGEAARGATAYVTLEPCAHHGQTPPCATALAEAGIARVVAPLADRDPRVSGKGFEMLRRRGIEVTTGILAEEAARDHSGFFLRIGQGRPHVTLKLASSFDGRIATATGESRWITGPEARAVVHALRASHDAVMVGAGTARADDPDLTVRGWGPRRQPVRVVVSRLIDVPLMSRLAASARDVPVWLVHGRDAPVQTRRAWESCGARLLPCALTGGRIDPAALLSGLAAEGLTRVFCEGGGQLAASLLGADLVDELVGFTAGVALGAEGRPGIGALGIDRLAEAPRFTLAETRVVGADVMHRWHRRAA
ncbi:bifunctional diaminohydroxyphosphoribosylaminopyrimidine deaminase/5-amino-6-(5-phosphoribosylamino)uracil reductase RibD [Salipiger marinus]|uniref:Riboflavin biosynthesis protein RibD n=1 Tax=Salipiger marinus TaxID=555512 RepID=A0A1G8MN01_9RHOB|nr:bifunctional diaminohydroxyphosphoribosylaminopyrimidine deaminase/5-amino-6-(5-phosphoribosylamino)uracil reductase RibD [Salipiger manganoxidans]MEB3419671.1 bifunctional diaminohydroxyphosphoribosylaminopyrimidine deaminase/5-amino-6-(5-phosphoribosylamino)uracil reductase RibD [Salipiger manganoxidans]SDI69331.1 diaminohydroxyphosphoribosylaminopyrimidine deaminase [Salipiger marinus]